MKKSRIQEPREGSRGPLFLILMVFFISVVRLKKLRVTKNTPLRPVSKYICIMKAKIMPLGGIIKKYHYIK